MSRSTRAYRAAMLAALFTVTATAALIAPAAADPPIGPLPAPTNTVTMTASPVTDLEAGQAITFSIQTSGTATLVGGLNAHLCQHGLSGYGTTNFGYSGASASRCVYDTGTAGPPGIVSGGLTGADYEKSYGPYSGSETNSGPLTFHVGTGSVTWGNATGFGPFTLDVDAAHPVDLVVQVNLAGDDVATTYFVQPLQIGAPAAPGKPTAVKVAPGSASAAVSWTAPTSIGHSPITGYVVTPYIGSTAQTAHTYDTTATSQTVGGLTNKRTYTFHVAAKNAIGTGAKSVASAPIVIGAPKAPFNVKASSGSTTTNVAGIRVSFSAGSDNGSAVTKYTARCASSNGGVARGASHNGSAVVQIVAPKATVKKAYTCTVDATNARGTSPRSVASVAVTVGAPAEPAKPTVTTPAAGSLRVSFAKPVNNGAAITSFTAACTSANGGVTGTKSGSASPLTVTGLTTLKTYSCTVKAINARGSSPLSPPSSALND